MKILREKIFGAIKRANKAKKRDSLIEQGRRLELTSDLLGDIDRPVEYYNNLPEDQMIRRARGFNKNTGSGIETTEDKLARKLKEKTADPKKFMQDRKKQASAAASNVESREIENTLNDIMGSFGLKVEPSKKKESFVSWEARHKAEKQKELAAKKAERLAASKASIEKHKGKAEELRNNNKLNIAARDAKRWIKKNPGKSAAIGATVAAGAGLGYAAYKHYKNKKKDSDKK